MHSYFSCVLVCFIFNNHNFLMIFLRYSHGENVKGAYHCQFGVIEKSSTSGQNKKPDLIRGMELTGSVREHINPLFMTKLTSRSENK